jgi:hypothetical protein
VTPGGPKVDLDLDAIRPPNKTFQHRGRVYEIPAELAVETIILALQLRERFNASQREDDEEGMTRTLEALREIVAEALNDAKAGQPQPRLTPDEITNVITMAMGGDVEAGDTPERAASDAITPPDEKGGGGDDGERPEGDPTASTSGSGDGHAAETTEPPKKKSQGSRSRRRSPAPSSA